MEVRFVIFVRLADGAVVEAFRWTRDEASGVARAMADAARFGFDAVEAWAVPVAGPQSPSCLLARPRERAGPKASEGHVAASWRTTTMQSGSAFNGFLILTVIVGLYLLPTLIALYKRRVNTLPIFLVNLVFGWTFIGWFAALIWALTVGPQVHVVEHRTLQGRVPSQGQRICHD